MGIKRFFTGLLALLASVWMLAPALAESTILYVSPSRVVIPPGEEVVVMNVSNQSTEPRRYQVSIVNQVMNEEGLTQRQPTFEYAANRMLRYVPKRFTLQAGERQVVRVMAKRPGSLADGDYHSHMLFKEIPLDNKSKAMLDAEREEKGKTTFDIRAIYGVAVPIIVQQGTLQSNLALGKVDYVPSAAGSPAHLVAEFLRSGNSEAAGRLQVIFEPSSGEAVELVQSQWIPVYREVEKITKRIALNNIPEGLSLKGGKLVLTLSQGSEEKGNLTSESKTIAF